MNIGGRYIVEGNKKPKQLEAPTRDHPEGNAPRAADGTRLDRLDQETPDKALVKTQPPKTEK